MSASPCACPQCQSPPSAWRWALFAALLSIIAVAARLHGEHWRGGQHSRLAAKIVLAGRR